MVEISTLPFIIRFTPIKLYVLLWNVQFIDKLVLFGINKQLLTQGQNVMVRDLEPLDDQHDLHALDSQVVHQYRFNALFGLLEQQLVIAILFHYLFLLLLFEVDYVWYPKTFHARHVLLVVEDTLAQSAYWAHVLNFLLAILNNVVLFQHRVLEWQWSAVDKEYTVGQLFTYLDVFVLGALALLEFDLDFDEEGQVAGFEVLDAFNLHVADAEQDVDFKTRRQFGDELVLFRQRGVLDPVQQHLQLVFALFVQFVLVNHEVDEVLSIKVITLLYRWHQHQFSDRRRKEYVDDAAYEHAQEFQVEFLFICSAHVALADCGHGLDGQLPRVEVEFVAVVELVGVVRILVGPAGRAVDDRHPNVILDYFLNALLLVIVGYLQLEPVLFRITFIVSYLNKQTTQQMHEDQ